MLPMKDIPPYKVLLWNINLSKVEFYDIMPQLVYVWEETKRFKSKAKLAKDREIPKTFEEIKKFILQASSWRFRNRCEYEVIIVDWPNKKHEEKIDAFKQIEANIDVITNHFIKYYINE